MFLFPHSPAFAVFVTPYLSALVCEQFLSRNHSRSRVIGSFPLRPRSHGAHGATENSTRPEEAHHARRNVPSSFHALVVSVPSFLRALVYGGFLSYRRPRALVCRRRPRALVYGVFLSRRRPTVPSCDTVLTTREMFGSSHTRVSRLSPLCHDSTVSGQVIQAGMMVHTALGPGLLESAYQMCLVHELRDRGLRVKTQVPLAIRYKQLILPAAYRLDLVVEGLLIVELKAVKQLHPLHEAQLLSYLKLSGLTIGLLINFHVPLLRDGIRRLVHGTPQEPFPRAPGGSETAGKPG
jgi:GxxExxY protein